MSIYEQIRDMVMNLERLEHRLYENYLHTTKILKVNLPYKSSVFFSTVGVRILYYYNSII